jgi:CRISPR-associated protein (TIGR02584 family)
MNSKTDYLLCVTGLTPQVVTETLYALHQTRQKMPDEIHILSTREGVERARLTLLKEGWLARFYHDYQLTGPGRENIHIEILNDADKQPLRDVRTQADNQAMADGITEKIRQLTEAQETTLHVSIAGGRKTMGFYAGYALSLYGRPQDRLSHVLVSPDYESHPQFYYPTPYSQIIYANDPSRKPLDTGDADVILADIAFVRLRHGLDKHLLQGKSSFTESVKRAQQSFAPPYLIIDLPQRILKANKQKISLKPADFAFYLWVLYRQFRLQKPLYCPAEGSGDLDYAQEYLIQLERVVGEMNITERTRKTLAKGMEKPFFEQHKSQVNGAIRKALDIHAEPYLIHSHGNRPYTHYRINLDIDQIVYLEES